MSSKKAFLSALVDKNLLWEQTRTRLASLIYDLAIIHIRIPSHSTFCHYCHHLGFFVMLVTSYRIHSATKIKWFLVVLLLRGPRFESAGTTVGEDECERVHAPPSLRRATMPKLHQLLPLEDKSVQVKVVRFAARDCKKGARSSLPMLWKMKKKTTYRPRTFGKVKLEFLLGRVQFSETHRFKFTPPEVCKRSESFFASQRRFSETKVIGQAITPN